MSSQTERLPRVLVVPTAAVSRTAAEEIARVLAEAVAARGIAHWATTGGSSAPGIYGELAAPPLVGQVPWSTVNTWWGDDRFVAYDDPLSNVLPIAGLPDAAMNLHPFPTEAAIAGGHDSAWAAARYAQALEAALPFDDTRTPVFDLIVLGVGPDGHILSVFPGSSAWDSEATCVAIPAPTHVEPHVERVTIHPRLVRAARAVLVITTGAAKAPLLGRAWTGDDLRELPVRTTRLGTATWVLDEAAAADLPDR